MGQSGNTALCLRGAAAKKGTEPFVCFGSETEPLFDLEMLTQSAEPTCACACARAATLRDSRALGRFGL